MVEVVGRIVELELGFKDTVEVLVDTNVVEIVGGNVVERAKVEVLDEEEPEPPIQNY